MQTKLLAFETPIWQKGINNIAGVDEVGRGALAGPLVVGAVVLNKEHFSSEISEEIALNYSLINDSKLVSPKRREILAEFIIKHAKSYSIEEIPHNIVDSAGISKSTQMGFYNSIKKLKLSVGHILTDTFCINGFSQEIQTNIIRGDSKSLSIAAASIIAKVYRDNLMVEIANKYPEYLFEQHKGYGTKIHKEAIEKFGPCKIHRTSFEPIKSMNTNKTQTY